MHTGCQRKWLARRHHTTTHAKRMCTGRHHMRQRIYRARRQRYPSAYISIRQRIHQHTSACASASIGRVGKGTPPRVVHALLTSFNNSFTSFTWRPGRGGSGSARQRMCTGRRAPPAEQGAQRQYLYLTFCTSKASKASKVRTSMRMSWLYLAVRSPRQGAPVLIWPVPRPTTRSAIVVSSVSPDLQQ
jgi:hypothetical protein